MRFCESIRELDKAFTPKERGFIDEDEINMVREMLELKHMTDDGLYHIRNACVLYFSTKKEERGRPTLDTMDKMSAVVCVIDDEKFHRGMEV